MDIENRIYREELEESLGMISLYILFSMAMEDPNRLPANFF